MKNALRLTVIAMAVSLLSQPVMAGPHEDAAAAYTRRSYTQALQLWRSLAEQGNAEAEYNLGVLYDNGHGVPRDSAEAEKWYRLSAGQGLADAQFRLGLHFENAQGASQDFTCTFSPMRAAASINRSRVKIS